MNIRKQIILSIVIAGLFFGCKMAKVSAVGKIKTDAESISKGRHLFDSKCRFCHKTDSKENIAGPGLQGVLKKSRLPVSRRPATADNIKVQLKRPYKNMPSFTYLTEDEIQEIIAYLNTL